MTNKFLLLQAAALFALVILQFVVIRDQRQSMAAMNWSVTTCRLAFEAEHSALKQSEAGRLKGWREQNRKELMEKMNGQK